VEKLVVSHSAQRDLDIVDLAEQIYDVLEMDVTGGFTEGKLPLSTKLLNQLKHQIGIGAVQGGTNPQKFHSILDWVAANTFLNCTFNAEYKELLRPPIGPWVKSRLARILVDMLVSKVIRTAFEAYEEELPVSWDFLGSIGTADKP
jgi:hypothetical protein